MLFANHSLANDSYGGVRCGVSMSILMTIQGYASIRTVGVRRLFTDRTSSSDLWKRADYAQTTKSWLNVFVFLWLKLSLDNLFHDSLMISHKSFDAFPGLVFFHERDDGQVNTQMVTVMTSIDSGAPKRR